MKRTLLAIAASLALGFGAVGAASTAAEAGVSVHVGVGSYGGYPYGYYPYNHYRNYHRHYYSYPGRLVCRTVIKTKAYWRHHRKYWARVPVRSCYRVY